MKLVIACTACLLVAAFGVAIGGQTSWVDPSPHDTIQVKVEDGVTVEVLDWHGRGRPVILLAQNSQTAHIYDDWAVSLSRDFRVVAITRRGFGQSVSASDNFSTERLGRDILAVIDAERLQRPILIGHGIAGEEMSWIGVHAAERISGLVYLDAAYDRSNLGAEAAIARRIPAQSQPPDPHAMDNAQSLANWMSKGVGGPVPEAEVRQIAEFGPDGHVTGQRTPSRIPQAVTAQLMRVDPALIRVPVLAIYATRSSVSALPGCKGGETPAVQDACRELYDWMSGQLARSKQLFGSIPKSRVVDIPGANSFMFLSNGPEVTSLVKAFAATLAN